MNTISLSSKIQQLRKNNNLSQEQLAGKLSVSRQSVSKWEAGQSQPDIGKIIQLSEIFEVSTDYLLKDIVECKEISEANTQDENSISGVIVAKQNKMQNIFWGLCIVFILLFFFYSTGHVIGEAIGYL